MRLSFEKEQLLVAMNIVSRAISGKTTNPILECILFDAGKESIRLIANDDLEIGIETEVAGNILEPGKVAIDSRLIIDIVRKLEKNEEPIFIESDQNNHVLVKCGKAKFNIQGHDGEKFTYLPSITKEKYIKMTQLSLKEVIRQTIFSVSTSESNKILTGEYLTVHENIARFTTIDGYRLSIRNIMLKDNYPDSKAVIPAKSMSEISRIISGDNEKDIYIYFHANYVLFEFDSTTVVARTIEGEYMNVEKMYSSDYKTKLFINRQKLLNAIDSSTTLIKENDHVPIVFHIKDANLLIRAKSVFGEMDFELDAIKTGEDLKIAFNPKYVLDALRAIEEEEVTLYFTSARNPVFIRDADSNYIYSIFPVNFIE